MTQRNYSSTAAETTLSSGVDASTTTLTVSATTGFPAVPFILAIDAGAAAQELVLVTNVAGTTLTVTRAYDSTVGAAHDTGAVVAHSHAALDFREANTHVNATTGVHGAAGAVVGTTDAQTLTNKTVALGSNAVSGTKAQFNAAMTDADFATLTGTETLTGKTVSLADNTVEGAIKHQGAGNRLDATATAQTSQPAGLQIFTGRVSTTTNGLGQVSVTFPGTGFPNGVLAVSACTTGGTTISPVVESGIVSKTGMTLLWSGAPSTAVVFTYMAVGF